MLIKAVKPYIYPDQLNFKDKPFEAWKKACGLGSTIEGCYPKWLHGLWFRYDLCSWVPKFRRSKESRLVFVQPVSLYFDAGTSVLKHEVIPMVWDCWPCYYDKMERWMKRHGVKRAIFTSRQEMEAMKLRCPEVEMLWCPEAIDAEEYGKGKPLAERSIDILEFGRCVTAQLFDTPQSINRVCTKVDGKFIFSDEELRAAMGDAKITVCVPRSMTDPVLAGGIETLTQRYWEAMLSRMVIVGHCPQELIDLIGYNPVIEMGDEGFSINDILQNISSYQALVDKNRETALKYGAWVTRIENIQQWLCH